MNGPQIGFLADHRRLHMNHGPIDLIVEAFGPEAERQASYEQAAARFRTILDELVAELPELRRTSCEVPRAFVGVTARRMEEAACRHGARIFVTPMAAVAGAVADEVLAAMVAGRRLEKAYVNDGGDIALYLAPYVEMRLAIAGTCHGFAGRVTVDAASPVRGVATSGWRGRSHSLGIADAVTVLARDGASADVAATLIANAVDVPGHAAISRVPANTIDPDTDLGARLVTQSVGPLSPSEIAMALDAGLAVAEDFCRRGLIEAAALFLGRESRVSASWQELGPPRAEPFRGPLCPAGNLLHMGRDHSLHSPRSFSNADDWRRPTRSLISPLVGKMGGPSTGSGPEGGAEERIGSRSGASE